MGYYDYQRGLIIHHLNEEGSWNTHLTNCRNFILRAIEYYRPSVVTVLGSGWLLDLPLKEINDTVTEVNLVDIIHPPEVKEQVADLKKVILKEDDVSGGLINEVWQKAGRRTFFNKLTSLKDIEVKEYKPQFDPGMVISLNILTQLEALPVGLLKRKAKVDEESFLKLKREIQQNHVSFLKRHKSVLITDRSEVVTESSGKITKISSVLVDLPEAKHSEEWTWYFELKQSDYYNKRSVFKVAGIIL